ncbi:MAG: NAD-dependent epimerase/dehydratase family protein [Oscillospiraceae bacterium]|nr:NAD-dependent epimerase/dehydratase family protein [Oscillospiraceae bacterium]
MSESKCSVLLLGGTGVMGTQLCDILAYDDNFAITVTSRKERNSERVKFIKGDAKDLDFLSNLISHGDFDVIVDFMRYTAPEFSERVDLFLRSTKQYIYLSSARVYAESKHPLTESSPRLLDVCDDSEYLKTDEYALAKARQEDILYASGKSNYTIVRPGITYGPERLQLGISEKEEWLFRALCGNSVVFPKDIQSVKATMTSGRDVAMAMAKLINNPKAIGQMVHITSSNAVTWAEVAEYILMSLRKRLAILSSIFQNVSL